MSQTQEIRKLPKKTIIIIGIIIAISLIAFLVLKDLKEQKMAEIVSKLGHNNVSSMQVINKMKVEDKETRYKSTVYKVRFFDNNINKTCIGFIHIGRNNQYTKDFDCK